MNANTFFLRSSLHTGFCSVADAITGGQLSCNIACARDPEPTCEWMGCGETMCMTGVGRQAVS